MGVTFKFLLFKHNLLSIQIENCKTFQILTRRNLNSISAEKNRGEPPF